MLLRVFLIFTIGVLLSTNTQAVSYDGALELEQRYFFDAPLLSNQSRGQTSTRLEMEFFKEWNKGDDRLVFEPLIRVDGQDDERTHSDIRQLIWSHLEDNSELSIGIGQVFWGVTESQHLVDIINQTDGVENIDGEDKLGQPMVHYSYLDDFGNIDAFFLPGFRPRTFSGPDSRLNGGLVVDNNNQEYESAAGRGHLDFALRYSNTFGDWGVGLSWFKGTSREPDLQRLINLNTLNTTPYYPQITQFGADIQLTTDSWLIKLESIQRTFDDSRYEGFIAATFGAEYTLVGFLGSVYDLGILAEYSWDEREQNATSLFQNDVFIGARLAFNNSQDSAILFGLSNDLDNTDSRAIFIEANTRVAAALTMNIEARYFDSSTPTAPLFLFNNDSFIQIGLEYFFD